MNNEILVMGGGHQGLSMAAHLALCGEKVNLWNRTPEHIQGVFETNCINSSGIINGTAMISKVSSNISDVITDFIMVATPSVSHVDIARLLAPYISVDSIIVLNPGRTFGALEFAKTLRAEGCTHLPHIAETQTIVYTCRRTGYNDVIIYALKKDVGIASLKVNDMKLIMSNIPECIRSRFIPISSVIETSLSNIGMVMHCAPVVMNTGWIECSKVDFKYYYDGMTLSVCRFVEKIDSERLSVAAAMGLHLEALSDWLRRTYSVTGNSLYECIQNNEAYKLIDAPKTIHHRYIEEDVPCGLVPLESAGQYFNVKTPCVSMVIDWANMLFDTDFRQTGRKYDPCYLNWIENVYGTET